MRRFVSVLLCIALLLSACSGVSATTWNEQYELGLRYLEQGDYENAILVFQEAILIDPKRAEAYLGLAEVYIALGDEEKAAGMLTEALEAVEDITVVQAKLDELEATDDRIEDPPDKSVPSHSDQELPSSSELDHDLDSDSSTAEEKLPTWQELYNKGMKYLQDGNYQEAIDAFNAAIKQDPTKAGAYLSLADAYIGLGNTDQAIQILKNALSTVSDTVPIQSKLNELQPPSEPEPEPDPEPKPDPDPEPESIQESEPQPETGPVKNQIPGSNIFWFVDNNTLTLSGSGAMPDFDVYDYTGTAPWEDIKSSIQTVIIENGITNIGNYVFNECEFLTNVTVPGGVTSIGEGAFNACKSLANITISSSVASIGAYAFSGCVALKSITIPNSVTSIGENAFMGCESLESITLPDSITSIAKELFSFCISLTSITLPSSVTSIGDGAFNFCTVLKNITLPSTINSIGAYAFGYCNSLTSIIIPNNVTYIGPQAFFSCESLASISIPNSVSTIGFETFLYCISLTDIYYGGSEIEWQILSVEDDILEGVVIHYNS